MRHRSAQPTIASPPVRVTRALAPLAATLLLCAGACAALLVARAVVAGHVAFPFLAWNLFLAGLPFAFALFASLLHETARPGPLRALAIAPLLVLWLLFFPNAPYMVTDLAHMPRTVASAPRWFDSVLLGAFVGTGVTSGFASLLLVHGLVARRLGRVAAWSAITLGSLLGGFGIYLGRFTRLNSWDVLSRPGHLLAVVLEPLRSPTAHERTVVATCLYGGFILFGYVAIVALLHAGRHWLPAATPSPPPVSMPSTLRTSNGVAEGEQVRSEGQATVTVGPGTPSRRPLAS
jgi:uncharacterized membrane protein